MNSQLRCVHRHTIKEHPSCFAAGLVKYRNDREFEKLTGQPWFKMPGTKIGYLDIEVDNLNADFGSLLSWCIKERGGETAYDVVTKEDLFNGTLDKRVVQSCVDEMSKYDIIVGYYSERFDMPYVRAKAMHYNIDFPGYGDVYHWDLYFLVRAKLKISSRSLANACDYLNIKGKTPIDKDIWRRAKYGDPEALAEVLSHNIADVEITEQLHDRLSFTRSWSRKSL